MELHTCLVYLLHSHGDFFLETVFCIREDTSEESLSHMRQHVFMLITAHTPWLMKAG